MAFQPSQYSRGLQAELERPRKLNKICGSFEGLLCLFSFDEDDTISLRDYLSLSKDQIGAFQTLLDNERTRVLCKIGKEFRGSIWGYKEFPRYVFESRSPEELDKLLLEDLLAFLERESGYWRRIGGRGGH